MKEIIVGIRGKYKAIVDDEDFEWLSNFKWQIYNPRQYPYAVTILSNGKQLLMHRMILNAPRELIVDHKDGNGLNNQRSNIRLCTRKENVRNCPRYSHNTSGYKGVCWIAPKRKWRAQYQIDRKCKVVGYFDNIIDAARAYNKAIKIAFGEFASPNKIDD